MARSAASSLSVYLAGLATSAAEREQLGDPKLTRLFRHARSASFLYETRAAAAAAAWSSASPSREARR